jgi:hypothetical protein
MSLGKVCCPLQGGHDRQIGRLLALENATDVKAGLAIGVRNAGRVAHQATGCDGLALPVPRAGLARRARCRTGRAANVYVF